MNGRSNLDTSVENETHIIYPLFLTEIFYPFLKGYRELPIEKKNLHTVIIVLI